MNPKYAVVYHLQRRFPYSSEVITRHGVTWSATLHTEWLTMYKSRSYPNILSEQFKLLFDSINTTNSSYPPEFRVVPFPRRK